MPKQMLYAEPAKQALKKGIDSLADAVKVTLGPKGKNVVLEKLPAGPSSTKDGVSVAKEIELPDNFQNMGSRMVKEVASKTSDDVGDGTTTAIVLSQAIFTEGIKHVTAGYNPVDIQKGMEIATNFVVDELHKMSIPVQTKKEIAQVATISSNDPKIGDLIAEALEKIGKDGVITVEESKSTETTLEITEGMEIDRGYVSQIFITDPDRMEVYFDDPLILMTSENISNFNNIFPIIEKINKLNRSLLIVAGDVTGSALSGLNINMSKLRGSLKISAIKAPSFGTKQKDILEDMAILTGGKVISPEKGMTLKTIMVEDLGQAGSVTSTKDKTIILDAKGDKEQIKSRINHLKMLIENSRSAFDKDGLQERLSKLAGGVAVINVGAHTESAIKEIKDRVEDALHATQAASQNGVVVGGGVALLRAGDMLANQLSGEDSVLMLTKEQEVGAWIIQKACEAPMRQIVQNAGARPDSVISHIRESDEFSMGYNAATGAFEDLIKAGVIDPTNVTISAIVNASSVCGIMLLTECLISEVNPKNGKNRS